MAHDHEDVSMQVARVAGVLGCLGGGLVVLRVVGRSAGFGDGPAVGEVTRWVGALELVRAAAVLGGRRAAGWAWTRGPRL
ncbi:hypothetical protein GCM10010176_064040 [Nonomuraea spiralis]|nr:hypothetical protein GCM10010176_064040 [Nonomuraea spiralis]